MRTKNGENLPVDAIHADNYLVPQGEERVYHIKMENVSYHTKTGKKLSTPVIQKFGKKMYAAIMEKQLKRMGYQIEVLHDPVEWERKNAAAIAARKAKQMEVQQEAAAKAREAEKQAMKAEIIAELIAAGVQIPGNEPKDQSGEKKGPGRPAKDNND